MMHNAFLSTVTHSAPLSVALVEDDSLLREEMQSYLQGSGFAVHAVNSASALNDLLQSEAIALYVIDVGLPGESGLSLARRLRNQLPKAGIIIMSGRRAVIDRVKGYQEGADFYLPKPASPNELEMILRGLARRIHPENSVMTWTLSLSKRMLLNPHSNQSIRLTHREKKFLIALIQAKDNTLESWEIVNLLMANEEASPMSKHSLEEFVRRLRKKLTAALDPDAEDPIKSVWSIGYQLCIPIALK
jgi:DNA-binding response OmpR family regulator